MSGNYPHLGPVNIPGVVGVGVMGEKYVGIRIHRERRGLTRVTVNCPFLTLDLFQSRRVAITRPILEMEEQSPREL